jgi:hypothetical protein
LDYSIQTAQAVLAGMYAGRPPNRIDSNERYGQYGPTEQFIRQCGQAGMAYEPIPVHTFMPVDDDLVNGTTVQLNYFLFQLVKPASASKLNCPAYANYQKSTRAVMEDNWMAANANLVSYLKTNSGFETIDFDAVDEINGASEAEVGCGKLVKTFRTPANPQHAPTGLA